MNASAFLAYQRVREVKQEADRQARYGRPTRHHRSVRDRLLGDRPC